jgi:hypothetical protein
MAPPEVSVLAGHHSINSFVETEYFDKIAQFSKPLPSVLDENVKYVASAHAFQIYCLGTCKWRIAGGMRHWSVGLL